MLITHGDCPLDAGEFDRFMERLGPRVATEPLVLNRAATSSPTWFYPDVREMISVPIREGNRLFGWLLALNHTGAGDITNSEVEFGTVEACLMASVATILGIHCGNITLYQRAVRVLRQRRAGAHLGHRRQGPVHLRSQRSRGPALGVPGPRAGLQRTTS